MGLPVMTEETYMKTLLLISLAACLIALLASCASPTISPEEHARATQARPAAPTDEEWPNPDDAKMKQGSFPTADNLRLVKPDMGKDQVRELLGSPHFRAGLWGVHEWNYIFQLRTGKGDEYKTCQYMVRFDDTPLVTGAWWRTTDCAKLANPPLTATAAASPPPLTMNVPAPLPAPVPVVVPATAASAAKANTPVAVLFDFNGSGAKDILPQGREELEQLARNIAQMKTLDAITVTGHADRLGSATYNQALSQARAETARKLLAKSGIDARKVKTTGRGMQNPLVNCDGRQATPSLVQCLQPNRRVEIEVQGIN